MGADFQTEFRSWQAVLQLRKWTLLFFSMILVVLMSLFFVVVWEYQILSTQVSQLTNQVEIIAEVDPNLSQEQIQLLEQEIANVPGVEKVDFWSEDRSVQYIDENILSGYSDFLKKTQSDIPLGPLLRIQLEQLDQKSAVEQVLNERYGYQLFLVDSLLKVDGQSFAQQFIARISESTRIFQTSMVLLFAVILALFAYLVAFFLSERSRGFHLTQVLHLSPPYEFFPAFVMLVFLSFLLTFLGALLAFFFLGHFLVSMMFSLFVAFFFMDLILVWLGRFVITRWNLR